MNLLQRAKRHAIERMLDDTLYRELFKDKARARGNILVVKHRLIDPHDPLSAMRYEGEARGSNLFLNVGINRIWDLVTGNSSATFTNAEAQVGIGDSATAAAAGQTDLQAATNKTWVAMDATYPTSGSSQQAVFRSTFGSGVANYVWNEFAVRRATGTLLLDRGVSSMGTKTAGGVWTATVTLSIA